MSRVVGKNSLTPWANKTLTPLGNNSMNFGLARDLVVLLKTAAKLLASRRKVNESSQFFSTFESGGTTKHLMTGPPGNSESCLPETLTGKINNTI